jgi:hypothetical protein
MNIYFIYKFIQDFLKMCKDFFDQIHPKIDDDDDDDGDDDDDQSKSKLKDELLIMMSTY